MGELIMKRALKPWLHYDFVFKRTNQGKRYYKSLSTLHRFTKKVIKERKETVEQKKSNYTVNEEDALIGEFYF